VGKGLNPAIFSFQRTVCYCLCRGNYEGVSNGAQVRCHNGAVEKL